MAQPGTWRIDRITRGDSSPDLPYLITLQSNDGQRTLQYRTSGIWPAPGKNLFLRRYTADPGRDTLTLVETCPVIDIRSVHGAKTASGKQAITLDLAIDRKTKTRCSIFISKQYAANGSLLKETAYLRTEKGTQAHRSKSYLQPKSRRIIQEIVVDSRELYPWKFDAATLTKSPLRSGDYALRVSEKIVAVVERKEFTNMLANLSSLESYHAHLSELATYPAAALVIEAQYRDFLNPEKTHPVKAARCARALSDIAARHPNLQIIFAGNRKDANVWAVHFFEACSALAAGTSIHDEPVQSSLLDDGGRANHGGVDSDVRHAIMHTLPVGIRIAVLIAAFPQVPKERLSACLKALRDEGKLTTTGTGRSTTWIRRETAES